MRFNPSVLLAGLALAVLCGASPAVAAPSSGIGNTGIGNLGDSLLDNDLAKALSPAPTKQAGPPAKGEDWLPDEEMLRRLLQDGGQPAGEDVGRGESPLASVISGMRQAEGLIADESAKKPAAPVQREVVAQLEKLIAQMEKQCKGGQCNKPQDKKKQASKRSQPKEGQCDKPGEGECDKPGKQSKKPGQKANQSGTTSLAGAPNVSPAEQQELMKAAWGHLPERMRERMLQGSDNEFLPEYRDELQQYYRRLAERSTSEQP